ncbi:hypothetical protein PCANC_09201 [Puccinia coronata f. sp. avenae]|uniref:Lysophospholipase n=2 Tax=Puccinia coronata f. sp. avenae TaxID=200324 RepID=A0A2N5SZC2_9BASI|nr:hypothetical protein PCANC_09201 [Puccinia coronata f. sp. avenae]
MASSFLVIIVHFALLFTQSSASTAPHVLERRDPAMSTSLSGTYAPVYDKCPAHFFLREPNKLINGMAELSQVERDYVNQKAQRSIDPWRKYLQNVKLKDFDIESFLSQAEKRGGLAGDNLPNFGLSLSGGGARALCLSGSILQAFDGSNPRANAAKVGGILQLSNYAVGVSGASWLLGAWGTSNFPPISSLTPKWRLSEQNDIWDWNVAKHYRTIYKIVKKKKQAGFPTNVVDFWGRLLSRLFIDDPSKEDPYQGEGVLWSSIAETSSYKNREVPYVIAIATSRPGIKQDFTPYSPIYEFSAEEFGVFHPRLNASIPMQYLGSPQKLNGGYGTCVRGYDNAGFIMGLSSNIYSMVDSPNDRKPLPLKVIDKFTDDDNFEGKVPNTFQQLGQESTNDGPGFQDNMLDTLLMADCGFINESIPIYPLLQPERKIDAIIAVDASSDGKNTDPTLLRYPNGTALYSSYSRTLLPLFRGRYMPKIPNSVNGSFTDLGYHKRPTFFGCNDFKAPLIIYLPNYYAVGETNQPTSQTTYTPPKMQEKPRIHSGPRVWHAR